MNHIINRKESRIPASFASSQKFSFSFKGGHKAKRFFMRNISDRGLGCLTWGSEFIGRGSILTSNSGTNYTIRWVRVKFGFVYEFGLEKA